MPSPSPYSSERRQGEVLSELALYRAPSETKSVAAEGKLKGSLEQTLQVLTRQNSVSM